MEEINNVQVEIDNDKYRLFVDGVEKSIDCISKITLSFFGDVKTKEQ